MTGVQIAKFVRWASSAHSWYKHMPQQACMPHPPLDSSRLLSMSNVASTHRARAQHVRDVAPVAQEAALFSFVLDLSVAMKRAAAGFVEQHEGEARRTAPHHTTAPHHRTSQTPSPTLTTPLDPLTTPHTPSDTLRHPHAPSQARTHYSWLPTRAYREAFGLLTYRDALPAFQPACAFGDRSVSVQRLSGARVWVPAHLVQSGSCYVTVRASPRSLQPCAIQGCRHMACTGVRG